MASHTEFIVRISTVNQSLFSGSVVSVTAPGSEGDVTILANHEPFVTLLKRGVITLRKRTGEEPVTIAIESGVLETSSNQMTVLI